MSFRHALLAATVVLPLGGCETLRGVFGSRADRDPNYCDNNPTDEQCLNADGSSLADALAAGESFGPSAPPPNAEERFRAALLPSLGALTWRDQESQEIQGCLGTVIAGERVLTARHCVHEELDTRFTLLGDLEQKPRDAEGLHQTGESTKGHRQSFTNDVAFFDISGTRAAAAPAFPVEPALLASGERLTMPRFNLADTPSARLTFHACVAPVITGVEAIFSHDCPAEPSTSGAPLIASDGESMGIAAILRSYAGGSVGGERRGRFDATSLRGTCHADVFVQDLVLAEGETPEKCGNIRLAAELLGIRTDENGGVVSPAPKAPRLFTVSETADAAPIDRLVFLPDRQAASATDIPRGRMLVASNSGRLDAISFSEVAGSIKPGDALALAGENGFTCDGLNDFDFSPMARALVIACGEGVIRLSENSSGVSGRPLSAWSRTAIDGLEDVTAVAAHPSRNIFATVDSDCNFSIIRGESIEPLRFSIFPQYCGSGVAGLAFAPEGDRLIAASRDQVCVLSFNDESLSLLRCSPFHTALVQLGDPTFIRDPQSGQIRLMIGGGAWPISAHWTNNLATNTSQDLDLHALAEEPMKWGLTSADLGLSFNGTGLVAGTNGGSLVILRAAGESWSVYSSMRSELLSISAVMTAPVGRMYASDCIQRGERDSNEFLAYATQSGNIYTALVLAPESKQCF